MLVLALFIAVFALTFILYKRRGQKTADCIHKGLVAGILTSVLGFALVTIVSYF